MLGEIRKARAAGLEKEASAEKDEKKRSELRARSRRMMQAVTRDLREAAKLAREACEKSPSRTPRAAQLLRSGSPLGRRLGGRFGFELRIVILSAARVIEKLHKQQDIFSAPRLHGFDRIRIMVAACRPGMRHSPDRR